MILCHGLLQHFCSVLCVSYRKPFIDPAPIASPCMQVPKRSIKRSASIPTTQPGTTSTTSRHQALASSLQHIPPRTTTTSAPIPNPQQARLPPCPRYTFPIPHPHRQISPSASSSDPPRPAAIPNPVTLSETALASGDRGEREGAFASVTVARVSDVLSPIAW